MSFQVGPTCYSTALSAAQAAASSQIGSVVQLGTAAYVVDVLGVADTSITYRLTSITSTSVVDKTVPFTALNCGLLDTSDGLLMGWGIATAWIVTAGILFLRRGIHE